MKYFLIVIALIGGGAALTYASYANNRPKEAEQLAVNQKNKSELWKDFKKPSNVELRAQLTDTQYKVTQENATEVPYQGEYLETKEDGIYIDIVSGEPLYSSIDKYDSNTGWPSFTQPLEPENIISKEDLSGGMTRIEVRSRLANSHLGHIFNDGPTSLTASGGAKPTGLRHCINSAALGFIPKESLVVEGYGEYVTLFEQG